MHSIRVSSQHLTMTNRHDARHMPDKAWVYVSNRLIAVGMALIPAISAAESQGYFAYVASRPISELWLNPGFYSYHVQRNKGLNDNNIGLGAEYRYSTANSVTLGVFENSDRQTSHYAGWYWQPLGLGPVRIGAVVGAIDGYPMWNGGWFVAVIPAASIEYSSIGANLLLIPSYKNKLYGSITFQLKLRVF